ncbi:MAG: REC domain-containing diguanylate cyclase [Arcobacter sp.]|nr:MAG: REC domain-containing diguanylate cyclase [Arcobacter sp.]
MPNPHLKNILVVDDSKYVRTIIKNAITRCNEIDANLFMAESYEQTQELIAKHHFHIAVLDVTLPDAPNGEVIDLLISHDVPVVVLTGGINKASKNVILEKDIVEYITKSNPQSISYIVAVVKRVLKNYDAYILLVDDSKSMRMTTRLHLERLHVNVLEASSAEEAIEILQESEKYIPLVLTDHEMPGMSGMELTLQLRQTYSKDRLSIIAISGSENSKVATDFIRHGANDFIKKPFTNEELAVRINVNLELIDLFRQSKETASKDFLTGLFNRRFFFESGIPILDKAKRKKVPVAVAMLDIDFFKRINDTFGHDVGDIAIKEVKTILEKYLRGSDLIARFGGEEFCILMENISVQDLQNKFESIRKAFENNTITHDLISFSYTVSIGICYGSSTSLESMINFSDKALYEAKGTGRNKLVIHTHN